MKAKDRDTLNLEALLALGELRGLIAQLQNNSDRANSYSTRELYQQQVDILSRVKATLENQLFGEPLSIECSALEYRKADGKDRTWSVTNDSHYMASIPENTEYETCKLYAGEQP